MKHKKANRVFSRTELQQVGAVALLAEELVNNHFKLSSGQWLKNRYDIKTAKDFADHERVDGPYAQVMKYEARKKDVPLGSSSFSLYAICIQDPSIISAVEENEGILLAPLLLYVLVHELVHVVRFLRFKHRYENAAEASVTLAEEKRVHRETQRILESVSMRGLSQVIVFFGEW